jgi:hypothetical protein
MASIKKFSGNLILQTPLNTGSNITLDTDNVYLTGNLIVQGNTTQVSSNNLTITDNVIVLNKGETGAGVTKGNAGVIIDRGTSPPAQIQWRESFSKWQIATSGTNYANISTSSTGLTVVFEDTAPVLGGNLNVNGKAIYGNTSVMFGSNIQLNYPTVVPSSSLTNATLVYGGAPGGGTAGIYVVNSSASNQELITKTRSFGFSLIL